MGCFGNPIVVSGFILCNILYCIVESFSLIRGRRHGWPNHVKTSCTVCVIVLSLCYWSNIVGIKAFVDTTIGIRARLKISGRAKDHKAHKMKTKGIFTEGGVDCFFVVIYTKWFVSWSDWKLTSWNLVQGGDCYYLCLLSQGLGSVPNS